MKHLLFTAIISLLLVSCAVSRYSETVYAFDYNNHDHPGFVVSPIATGMDYKALADIRVEFVCGKVDDKTDTTGLESFVNPMNYSTTIYRPSSKRILNSCIEAAKKFGADGIINFKIEYSSVGTTSYVYASGIAVSLSNR